MGLKSEITGPIAKPMCNFPNKSNLKVVSSDIQWLQDAEACVKFLSAKLSQSEQTLERMGKKRNVTMKITAPLVMAVTIAAIAGGAPGMKTSEQAYVSLPDGKFRTKRLSPLQCSAVF